MNILIVDDDATNRKLLCAILEAEGHNMLESGDGTEALAVLKHKEIDTIISDILMPRMDGYRFCYEVRASERFRHLPFIFYTASYTSPSDQKLALEIGADQFLIKPSPAREIIQALREASTRKRAPVMPIEPASELNLMKEYNQHLVTKLEQANTELITRNEELLRSKTYAQNIVDTVREPLLILDTTSRVRSANRSFYQAFQVSPEDTENRLFYELGSGQWNIPELKSFLKNVILEDSVFDGFQVEYDFPAIGRRMMLLNARKLQAGHHEELLVLSMEDVTERRRAEEKVVKAKEAAESASKTKSRFLANMSHELRTPLNAILGYSELLQEEFVEQKQSKFVADLEKIHGAGAHLLTLINDILDLSKIEAGKMELFLESFDVITMINEVASIIRPLADKNFNTLHVQRASNLGVIHADQIKVRQGLINLLSNAVKFTHKGNITIEADRQSFDGSERITFRVKDTGIGLSPEQIAKLFTDFTQADNLIAHKFGGTGLGLALTRRFCERMGGEVTVRSVLGEGSVFTIQLPTVVQ
jgi:signal transduction histidine kinase/CheY-like chemotaxis protein